MWLTWTLRLVNSLVGAFGSLMYDHEAAQEALRVRLSPFEKVIVMPIWGEMFSWCLPSVPAQDSSLLAETYPEVMVFHDPEVKSPLKTDELMVDFGFMSTAMTMLHPE